MTTRRNKGNIEGARQIHGMITFNTTILKQLVEGCE